MKVLSLFSGGGLGDLGLELAGMQIVGQVEIDDYCQKILKLRWPDVPKWTDIKNVKGDEIKERCGAIDIISGGFPCQPHSFAGKRKGAADDRNLWPEMFRIISEIRSAWVLAENVPGILGFAESVVLPDLEGAGYEAAVLIFPAHALGAPHRRDRVWIVAHAGGKKSRRIPGFWAQEMAAFRGSGKNDSDANIVNRRARARRKNRQEIKHCNWWTVEPRVGRVAHGVPKRVDRLKLLGNGQVVHCVRWIAEKIMRFKYDNLHELCAF